ncbi:Uncharacterized protein dnl_48060 [Desulfonema limicola]|uniref:Uncharacterized protein n=1 Tax=Desulfonema limicola TaxID=45656 RepID=A0A975BBS1_9BACT|nr:Uncharacterized protein dnl_48060 [Desulfonema limicola]
MLKSEKLIYQKIYFLFKFHKSIKRSTGRIAKDRYLQKIFIQSIIQKLFDL